MPQSHQHNHGENQSSHRWLEIHASPAVSGTAYATLQPAGTCPRPC